MREILLCLGSLPVPFAGVPVPFAGVPVPFAGVPVPFAGVPVPFGDALQLATSIGVWRLTAGWEDSTPLRGFGFGEVGQLRRRPVRFGAVLASTEGGFCRLAALAD